MLNLDAYAPHPNLSVEMFVFPVLLLGLAGIIYGRSSQPTILAKSLALLFLFCAAFSGFGQTLPNGSEGISCTIEPDPELDAIWQRIQAGETIR
jgi:hypothetical protein